MILGSVFLCASALGRILDKEIQDQLNFKDTERRPKKQRSAKNFKLRELTGLERFLKPVEFLQGGLGISSVDGCSLLFL